MTLTVCLLARNEEQNLARALASVRGIADEIVVCDTGSTDATVEVALSFGARVVEFPWCDDFAAARNHAFAAATSDWIFLLDSDEELLPESLDSLRRAIQDEEAIGFLILRQDLRSLDRLDEYSEMWQLRIFRRSVAPPQIGRCHPQFQPSLQAVAKPLGLRLKASDIRIRHYGYVTELTSAKLQRAAKLLRLELADRPGSLYYEIELAMTLLGLADSEAPIALGAACSHLLEHADDEQAPTPTAHHLLEYLVVTKTLQPGWTREKAWDLADRWHSTMPIFLFYKAAGAFGHSNFEEAAGYLERLLEMGETGDYDHAGSFRPSILGDEARLNLAAAYIRLGKLEEACTHLERIKPGPYLEPARQNLAAIRELQGQSEGEKIDLES